jgi:hypothetical protein
MDKKKKSNDEGKDNEDDKQQNDGLDGFSIEINEFGEIITNTPVEDLNKFLNKNLIDKKLINKELEEE